ncbi:MAG: flagellar motor switch protein FliN [Spirochaetia bacterium]|nr:flagellar motor switch protein FliN [Spirochaetia bacterium]
MGDASLSQEEIDALLMGADDVGEEDNLGGFGDAPPESSYSSSDFSALVQSFNEAMVGAAQAASSLVNKNINITDLQISDSDRLRAGDEIGLNSIVIDISMGSHRTAIVFDEDIAKRISMYMMGATQAPEVMDEAYLSTLNELANTILSSLSNNLGQKFKDNLVPSSPTAIIYKGGGDLPDFDSERLKKFEYELTINMDEPAKLVQYISEDAVLQWNNSIGEESSPAERGGGFSAPQQQSGQQQGQMSGGYQMSAGKKDYSGGSVNINPVNYPSLTPSGMKGQMPSNIDLLLDVQMILTVELGRTRKYVKDILGLGEGSIIELDKLAGEPVDLLVNGKLIAKGEVVVIDENFGVRVTDIVGPAERLARLAAE